MSNSSGSGTLGRLVDSYRAWLTIAVWIIHILFVLGGAIAGWTISAHFSYGGDGDIIASLFGGSIGGFYSWLIDVFVIAPQAVLLTIRDEIQRLNKSNDELVRALTGKDTTSDSASSFHPYIEHNDDEPMAKDDVSGDTWTYPYCGAKNPLGTIKCEQCETMSSTADSSSSAAGGSTNLWFCKKCGSVNSKSMQSCYHCGEPK